MRVGVCEAFKTRAEYYASQPGFCRAWLDEAADETVAAMLELVPSQLLCSPRYRESVPATGKELRRTLQAQIEERLDCINDVEKQKAGDPARLAAIPLQGIAEGAMPTDFWESLRQGFMQLRAECAINPPVAPAGRLTAIWTAVPEPGHWRLRCHSGKDGSGVAKRFAWHAQSGAAHLGFVGDDDAALAFWLDRIKREAPQQYVNKINVTAGPDGAEQLYSVEILDICGLSADYCRKCEADQIRSRAASRPSATEPTEGAAKGAMSLSQFWRERQAEFEKYQQQFQDLKAHWYVSGQTWWLQYGESSEGILSPPQQVLDVFKAIARTIVAGWTDIRAEIASKPHPRVPANAEPWEAWLDFMRIREWGFRATGHTRCNEYEWDAGVKDGKALNAVRKELKYTIGDEDKNLYRRLPDGSLKRLSAKELKGKRSEDLRKYYHWLEDGMIEHVFESSARFCEDLAARAFEAEAAARVPADGDAGSAAGRSATPPDTVSYPKRATWLESELALREWSVHDLQAQGGPNWKTSRKILNGLPVSRSVLEKTAAALSKKKGPVLFGGIPQE
jgi:hypothetical protein